MQAVPDPTPTTAAAMLRDEGNRIRGRISKAASNTMKRSTLESAITKYTQSLAKARASKNLDDEASALKNITVARFEQATTFMTGDLSDRMLAPQLGQEVSTFPFLLQVAFETGALSLNVGRTIKSAEWLHTLDSMIADNLTFFVDGLTQAQFVGREARTNFLKRCCSSFEKGLGYRGQAGRCYPSKAATMCYMATVEELFKFGHVVTDMQAGNYLVGISIMAEAAQFLTHANGIARLARENADLLVHIEQRQCDISESELRFHAVQQVDQADLDMQRHFQTQIDAMSGNCMDYLWEVVDRIKYGALLAKRSHLLGTEARCDFLIGRFFSKVLKLEAPAHRYFKNAIELSAAASSLNPPWFTEAMTYIENIRVRDEHEASQDNEEVLTRLKPLLDAINAIPADSGFGIFNMVKHIYKEHPPRVTPAADGTVPETPCMPEMDPKIEGSVKKGLIKVIFHYHSDRQVGQDREWKVLALEITKKLNNAYDKLKGGNI